MSVISKAEHVNDPAIVDAWEKARAAKLTYGGTINPFEAWRLYSYGAIPIVDVRSAEERKFVGHVPGSLHIAWQVGFALEKNSHFVIELESSLKKDDMVFLLCRSGNRSALAADAATKAGFKQVFNIRGGFEGDLDQQQQRGKKNGWRYHRLPWVQD